MDRNEPTPPPLPPPPAAPPVVGQWSASPPPAPPPFPPSYQQQFGPPPEPSWADKLKKALGPTGVVLVICLKFFAKLKFVLLPVLKFLPVVLKTGGTMVLSIWLYALYWGVWFAVGFVVLIFVHECGHLLAAKRIGLKVGAPVFIPFMGAVIALKEAPKNAWIEAQVGIGGPILGSIGAAGCMGIYSVTGNPMFMGLAYTGFLLNLFNLAPVGFLDGGRIVTALSPWLWLVGFSIVALLTIFNPNPVLILILLFSLPRLFSLFRKRTEAEQRFYEVKPWQRVTMGAMYFGLIAALLFGMEFTYMERGAGRRPRNRDREEQQPSPERDDSRVDYFNSTTYHG